MHHPPQPHLAVGAPVAVLLGSVNHPGETAQLTTITRIGPVTLDVASGERFNVLTLKPSAREPYPWRTRLAAPDTPEVLASLAAQARDQAFTDFNEATSAFKENPDLANTKRFAAASQRFADFMSKQDAQ